MKQTRIIFFTLFVITGFMLLFGLHDTAGAAQWLETYGGTNNDYAYSVRQTTDGGFVVAGNTGSSGSGLADIQVLKLDSIGNVVWQKTYGGTNNDYANYIELTSDGGYIVAGSTYSFGAGVFDMWVLKLDSDGNVIWQKTYGGSAGDSVRSVRQTSDGGYIIAGNTSSYGAGALDMWILKLDSSGSVTWQKTYGGTGSESSYSIQQTTDGSYIVAGYTSSFGAGGIDCWVLKLSSSGGIIWQQTYGGSGNDYSNSIQTSTYGGYIVAGYTASYGAGGNDAWVFKIDGNGNMVWQKTYGGTGSDYANSIQQTSDGGYVAGGYTGSFGAGGMDNWVFKVDSSGNVTWQKTYGGTKNDYSYSVQQISDGGYITAGSTSSYGAGGSDVWVLRLDTTGEIRNCAVMGTPAAVVGSTAVIGVWTSVTGNNSTATTADTTITPQNSSASGTGFCNFPYQASSWAESYGGSANHDYAYSIEQTSDGGFIVAGAQSSFSPWNNYDYWVLKLNSNGNAEWQKSYGSSIDADYASSIHQTTDGGYIVAGNTKSFSAGLSDMWVMKTNSAGSVEWSRVYGNEGSSNDYVAAIRQTSDGGYILAGTIASHNSFLGIDFTDTWLLKLDSNGNIVWQKAYSHTTKQSVNFMEQTDDGGYILAGRGEDYDMGTQTTDYYVWVVKTDGSGNVVWQKKYSGSYYDSISSIRQTKDGGYIVAGYIYTVTSRQDVWVLKLDNSGNIVWQKSYGSTLNEVAYSIQRTSDGGYIVAGLVAALFDSDGLILKLDESGNVIWAKKYAGTEADAFYSVQQTADGGYIAAGETQSFSAGLADAWILKLDNTGSIQNCSAMGTFESNVNLTDSTWIDEAVSGINVTSTPVVPYPYIFNTNSTRSEACFFKHMPDLIVESITTNPVTPLAGQTMDVTVQVMNQGKGNADAFAIDFYKHLASAPGIDQSGDIYCSVSGLGAGETDICTGKVSYASGGNYSMWAQVDTNQLIPESDETNNVLGPQNLTVVSFHTLSVTRSGTGSGTVASTPSGINCGTTCSASFSNGTSVSLKADPAAGSVFAGWSGACTGTASTCTVTMDAAKSVTAVFNLQTYLLSVTKSGTGSGTVTSSPSGINCGSVCSASYNTGTSVTLTAAAGTNSVFAGWSGACTGTASTCTVTMDAAKSVTATFNLQTYLLSVTKSGIGGGTVTSSPSGINCGIKCSSLFTTGSSVTLTAAADANSVFAGWSGACTGTASTCTVTMDAAKSVTAAFDLQTYLLSVTKTGTGSGTVTSSPAGINCGTTCSASYNSDTSVTLTATADSNSVFAGWSGDADCSDANVTMTVSKTCTASFTRIRFEETDPSITYTGVWNNYTCSACSAGAIKISKNIGARATFTFTGTGVKWIAAKAKQLGIAKVYVDGVLMTTVDLYSATAQAKKTVYQVAGLTAGNHTIAVEVTGQKNSASTGLYVDIDAFDITP